MTDFLEYNDCEEVDQPLLNNSLIIEVENYRMFEMRYLGNL